MRKTDLILAGRTKAQMMKAIVAGIDKKELPAMESGAMCYMLSKRGYLSDRDGHWHPHCGSPIIAFRDTWEGLIVFLIPVREWSDGTSDR